MNFLIDNHPQTSLEDSHNLILSNNNLLQHQKSNHLTHQIVSQPIYNQITISSQAYPSPNDGELLYQIIKQPHSQDHSLTQNKKVLKPQVKSQIHQKLLNIHFSPQNHYQPIHIRPFHINDLKQLKNLQNQWFPIRYTQEFYKKIIRKQCYCFIAETAIKYPQSQQSLNSIIYSALVFQITSSQGYAYRSWKQSFLNLFKTTEDSIYIMTLGVIDQFRKKGVGRMLIQKMYQVAKQYNNIKLIYLHVISYNKAAINFYKKIGFNNLQSLQKFYHVGGKQFNGQVYGMFVNGGKNNSSWSLWLNKLFK